MKIALIPPTPDLDRFAELGDGIHMLLAHVMGDYGDDMNIPYIEYYRERARQGDYLILDNGAHESQELGLNVISLLRRAAWSKASEIVMPDVPGNALRTIAATEDALHQLTTRAGEQAYANASFPRLMYVPQGASFEAWRGCLRRQMALHHSRMGPGACVIGVAKHHMEGTRPFSVAEVTAELKTLGGYAIVHLLGWPRQLWTLADFAQRAPFIRSVDSARPFVYANAGVLLEPGGVVPGYPRRSASYFEDAVADEHVDLAHRNVETFRAAAVDKLIR